MLIKNQKILSTTQIRQKALKLLAQREHSKYQLLNKLSLFANSDDIKLIIDQLAEDDWQSDRRYTLARIEYLKKKFGRQKIINDLKISGIDQQLINEYVIENPEFFDQAEIKRGKIILTKKFKSSLSTESGNIFNRKKLKKIHFLQSRGFSSANIKHALELDE